MSGHTRLISWSLGTVSPACSTSVIKISSGRLPSRSGFPPSRSSRSAECNRNGPKTKTVLSKDASQGQFVSHDRKGGIQQSSLSTEANGCSGVESECGAAAVGPTYLLPPLSSGGASLVRPWLRFHTPLIERSRRISRTALSDKTSRLHPRRAATKLC